MNKKLILVAGLAVAGWWLLKKGKAPAAASADSTGDDGNWMGGWGLNK